MPTLKYTLEIDTDAPDKASIMPFKAEAKVPVKREPKPVSQPDPFDIRCSTGSGPHRITYHGITGEGHTLLAATRDVGHKAGLGTTDKEILAALRLLPDSCNKGVLVGILEGVEVKERE